MDCSMPAFLVLHYLPEFAQTHVLWVGDIIQPSHLLPLIFPASGFYSMSQLFAFRWPKNWSFSFSFWLSSEYLGWISFRVDWFDLLAVQGTLKSLLQHHSSKASILQCSAFFIVQLSNLSVRGYWKNHCFNYPDLYRQSDVFAFMISRFIKSFLPRTKCLLISWLQSWSPGK